MNKRSGVQRLTGRFIREKPSPGLRRAPSCRYVSFASSDGKPAFTAAFPTWARRQPASQSESSCPAPSQTSVCLEGLRWR